MNIRHRWSKLHNTKSMEDMKIYLRTERKIQGILYRKNHKYKCYSDQQQEKFFYSIDLFE
jgi:hypothetical protein